MKLIAELGVNWKNDGYLGYMIAECERVGIRYAKMQLFTKKQVPKELRGMVIDKNKALRFKTYASLHGIELFFTPMYPEAVDICEYVDVKYYKVRHADRNNWELKNRIKETGKPVFVSCRGPWDTIWLSDEATFFYCVPKYPANYLYYIRALEQPFKGISDHTPDFRLYEWAKNAGKFEWFEMHVCWDHDCYEWQWSKPLFSIPHFIHQWR